MSWNIFQGLHHRSRRDTWLQNLGIESHLAALDADVLVLPEAWRFGRSKARWAEDLASDLGYELHQWVADRPSRARETVPWRMVILTRIPARRLSDQILPTFRSFGPRAIVRVELEDSGLTIAGVHLYGIHLLQRNPAGWFNERAEFRKTTTNNDIVAGDMNMWPFVVHRDAGPLRPAVKGRTYRANRTHSQIDHLLISDRVEILKSEVLPDMGSDHLGLRATLRSNGS